MNREKIKQWLNHFKQWISRWHVEVKEAEIIPSRFHGLGYTEPMRMAAHFYIIPINYIVKVLISINYWWYHVQTKRSWFDDKWMQAYNKGREEIFEARHKAFEDGKRFATKELMENIELEIARRRQEQERRREEEKPVLLGKVMD